MQKSDTPDVEISVVSPVYGHQLNLAELCERLVNTMEKIGVSYEIVLVNDASPDNAWEVIQNLCAENPNIKGLNLSRNFGQHSAITAGLDHSNGNWTVVIDCDLQDVPEDIERLYSAITDDVDMVLARKKQRTDSLSNIITSRIFYRILRFWTGISHDTRISSFGIYSRRVIDAVLTYRERFRSFGIYVHLVGFNKGYVEVDQLVRKHGKSSYSFFSRVDLAINSIVAHSDKPLKLSILLGLLATTLAAGYSVYLVFAFFYYNLAMSGFTTIIVSMLMLFGLHFILLGVVGLYVGRVFDETKNRPLYHVKQEANLSPKSKGKSKNVSAARKQTTRKTKSNL